MQEKRKVKKVQLIASLCLLASTIINLVGEFVSLAGWFSIVAGVLLGISVILYIISWVGMAKAKKATQEEPKQE